MPESRPVCIGSDHHVEVWANDAGTRWAWSVRVGRDFWEGQAASEEDARFAADERLTAALGQTQSQEENA